MNFGKKNISLNLETSISKQTYDKKYKASINIFRFSYVEVVYKERCYIYIFMIYHMCMLYLLI